MSDGAAPRETLAEPNPLLEGLSARRTPDPCTIVIFGAAGNLSRRKLLPALYALAHDGLGVGRRELEPAFPNYAASDWGPAAADRMLQGDGRAWRRQ